MEVDLAQLSILNDGDKKNNENDDSDKRLDAACGGMEEDEKVNLLNLNIFSINFFSINRWKKILI